LGFLQLKTGIKKDQETLLLLNEIQYSKNIVEQLCKLSEAYPHIRIIATTSGMDFQDHALSSEHQQRIEKITITPYRFTEYLTYHGMQLENINTQDRNHARHTTLLPYFESYLKRGSFPRVLEATSELDKINALKYIMKKYIDTDARFWFSGDFLITCEKAIGPLHSMTDQLLKPITLAKILKLSPYNTKKIVSFFLNTHCFSVVPCYNDTQDLKNTLHGHETIYSIDTGLLHHYIPFAISTNIYYKTFVINELLRYRGKTHTITSYRKRNGTEIDFLATGIAGNITIILCEEKNTGHIPRRLQTLPAHILTQCTHIIICTPFVYQTTDFQGIPLQFVPYYWLPQVLNQKQF
jgi:predicted AAA+ superfamily ATPase